MHIAMIAYFEQNEQYAKFHAVCQKRSMFGNQCPDNER